MLDFAIVGCGAAGSALLIQLAASGWGRIRSVGIIEPRDLATGIAFNRTEPYLLCNTSVAVNSLFPHNPDHLLSWLRRQPNLRSRWHLEPAGLGRSSFIPRGLLRSYIASHLDGALDDAARSNVTIEHLRTHVLSIEDGYGGFVLHDAGGPILQARDVAICTGLGISTSSNELQCDSAGFAVPAHRVGQELDIPTGHVGIIGSRQSAIDTALMITEHDPNSSVTLMSPSGAFPAVRTTMTERHASHFTGPNLVPRSGFPDEVVRLWIGLLRRELAAIDDFRKSARSPATRPELNAGLNRLRSDVHLTDTGDRRWEDIDRHAIIAANAAWPSLTAHQRTALRRHFRPLVRRYVSAIPRVNALRILDLYRQGRLQLTQGSARQWRIGPRTGEADDTSRPWPIDGVVDATGMHAFDRPDGLRVAHRPLRELSSSVDPTHRIRFGHRNNLFLIGPPAGEALAVTNYLKTAVLQAITVARLMSDNPRSELVRSARHA